MKKLQHFLWVLCLYSMAHSQTAPANENISLDQQLININQSSVSSGIIYERVITVANLYNFNKVSTFNTANLPYFKQALSEMYNASNSLKFESLDQFKNKIANTTANNEVDVAILNTQFHILNYNEQNPGSGGLLFNNSTNTFTPISGKSSFIMLHNTVIAPTKTHVKGTSITYKLNNNLYYKNGFKTIKKIVANFGDGINRTLISNYTLNNQSITVNYSTSGEKTSTFVITYNDNSTLTTYGKIYFHYQPITNITNGQIVSTPGGCTQSDPLKKDFVVTADIPFTGYMQNDPTILAQINYRAFYAFSHTDKKIRKPIIIIDGFDPGDKRKIEDCDCENDPECAARNTSNGTFDTENHRSMVDLMEYYDEIGLKKELLYKLRTDGYDVIMVNHPTYQTTNLQNGQSVTIDGGAYYIESNAMALIKLLQETKEQLVTNGSTSDIAIVAPSMAGQISRYALSYMEKKFNETNLPQWKHNTYLWISVDSPHLGANIPMGDQALLYLLKDGGVDAAADFYDKDLSSPAAQQQLIEFHRPGNSYHTVNQNMLNAQTTSQNMPLNRGNPYFIQHYTNQKNNGLNGSDGWPQNLRKIALANGSLTGSKQTQTKNGNAFIPFANNSEKVLNIRGFQRVHVNLPWPLGSFTFRIHIASLESQFMPAYGSQDRIARFKKLFNDKTVVMQNINPRGNMDNVPGGFFDAQDDISSSINGQSPVPGVTLTALNNWSLNNLSIENITKSLSELLGGSEWYIHEFNPIHSFIPSFSALAHLQPNQNWANPLNSNLTCTTNKLTPFDSYFGLEKNTQHTSFTKESVDWLLNELAGNEQLPNYPISEISGVDEMCVNSIKSFGYNVCKTPSTVTWSVSSNLQVLSQNDYTITVKGLETGMGVINATFTNGQTKSKQVWVGTLKHHNTTEINSSYQQAVISPYPMDNCDIVGFKVNFWPLNQQPLAYEWQKITTDVAWHRDFQTDNSNSVYVFPNCNKDFKFKVRVQNNCGWSEWFELNYAMNSCDNECPPPYNGIIGDNFVLNPNPVTNGILNISIKNNAPWFLTSGNNNSLNSGFGAATNFLDNPRDQLNSRIRVNIKVFNQIGLLLLTQNNTLLPAQINLSPFPPGNYLVSIEYMGQTESHTIIKN